MADFSKVWQRCLSNCFIGGERQRQKKNRAKSFEGKKIVCGNMTTTQFSTFFFKKNLSFLKSEAWRSKSSRAFYSPLLFFNGFWKDPHGDGAAAAAAGAAAAGVVGEGGRGVQRAAGQIRMAALVCGTSRCCCCCCWCC